MSRLQHKTGRKSNYIKSLNNDYDKEVRRKVLLRDNFKCQHKNCGSKLYLEKHHISYYVNGASIVGKELEGDNLKWVVAVCAKCHESIHRDLSHEWNPKNPFRKALKFGFVG